MLANNTINDGGNNSALSTVMAPQRINFHKVSNKLIHVRIIAELLFVGCALIIAISLGIILSIWLFIIPPLIVVILFFLWTLWLIPRRVHALGYAEGEHELFIRRGCMLRTMQVIPYGRIHFIEVQEGPIARKLKIVKLTVTVGMGTKISIEGIPVWEAERLRDSLAQKTGSEMMGL